MLDENVKQALEKTGIDYKELECDPDFADTAAFCEKYNFPAENCANTILVDQKVMTRPEVIMGGGNRTSKVLLDPKELRKLSSVKVEDILI